MKFGRDITEDVRLAECEQMIEECDLCESITQSRCLLVSEGANEYHIHICVVCYMGGQQQLRQKLKRIP
jgi:hypothetical protein